MNTPTPSTVLNNLGGGFSLTFASLRPDDSPSNPNQGRDRAKTFNQDDSLTITKYPTSMAD